MNNDKNDLMTNSKIIILKLCISIILFIFLFNNFGSSQKTLDNITKNVYRSYLTCSSFNSQCYKDSYNHFISNSYKPYINHVGGGNALGYRFAQKIIKKYYSNNDILTPTFFNLPYDNGVHVLLDGYRSNDILHVQPNEFLIRNYNLLFEQKEITEYGKEEFNVHGFFLDIKDVNIDGYIKINSVNTAGPLYVENYRSEQEFIINKNKLVSYDKFKSNKPFASTLNITNKSLKKISLCENCFYYELKNKDNLNFTIKLKKSDLVSTSNINKILYYGNYLKIKPYVVLERSINHYNYFFAKSLKNDF